MKEALKLALEALYDEESVDKAIAAIKEVLAQPAQELVEDVVAYHSDGTRTVRIALKRPWVGLTEEEASWCQAPSTIQTWKRIEAKLKEKNI